jgi:hypothetical protein
MMLISQIRYIEDYLSATNGVHHRYLPMYVEVVWLTTLADAFLTF